MAFNKRASSPGQPTKFQGEGELIGRYIPPAVDDGGAARSAAAVFSGIAGSLGEMADKAAMREGAAAGLAAGAGARLPDAPAPMTANPPSASGEAVYSGSARSSGVPASVIDVSLVDRVLGAESSGNPAAKAKTSSATGIGQMLKGTWLELVGRYRPDLGQGKSKDEVLALRSDAAISREMSGRYLSEIAGRLEASGIATTEANLYLGYFLGPAGAQRVLRADPSAALSDVVDPAAIASNGSVFGKIRTVGDLMAWSARKMGGKGTQVSSAGADLAKLSPSAQAMLAGIEAAGVVPNLSVRSGFRDKSRNEKAGGAKHSQHIHGNAIDIDLSGYTDDQKGAVLQAAIDSGARGIGVYASGNSLHVDTRDTPTLWGADRSNPYGSNSIDQAAAWAQPALRKLFGGQVGPSPANGLAGANVARTDGPPRSGADLVLRRDGTIYGNAYDEAALASHGWRLEAALHADLGNAYEDLKDDPVALQKRMGEIKQTYIADSGVAADPKMREALERSFYEKSVTYSGAVNRRLEERRAGEAKAAAAELVEAQGNDIERQAYLAGSSPDGDAAVAGLIDRGGRKIDSMIATGALTPAEGMKRRRELVENATNARIRGAFDALPDLATKEAFANNLLDQWKQGSGAVAGLDFRQVDALANSLRASVTKEREGARGDVAIAKAKLKRGVADDLASIEETGVGALSDGRPIDGAEVAAILGPAEAAAWSEKRDQARAFFETTHGFETMTDAEIDARVAKLAPTPGQEGYARQAELFAKAGKKAEAIQKQRREDPAAAASRSFQSVRDAEAAVDPQDPSTTETMIGERMHGQEALGVPELAREPLTKKEALELGREIFASKDEGAQKKATSALASTLGEHYGQYADEVLRQVISARGADRDLADYAAAVIRKTGLGQPPGRADGRRVDKAGEISSADRAMDGRTDDAAKILGLSPAQSADNLRRALDPNELIPVGSPNMIRTPTAEAIRRLVADKSLAPKFDEAFGPGTARFYLGGD
ncbi:D-Ala-D-Ala carboxypeptidase family metallohydrolase [Kaistia sp. MMO-174]|uniref:D-Ala-D-Ala carboxypeptidase family metallohydrolase n=1 Tax=Kaistia sp. MMO-174 TaxID=3081256 RepID=UPI0030173C9B